MCPLPPQPSPQTAVRRTSGLAIASMACGIASFVFIIVPAVAAIIMGHRARGKIKRSQGKLLGGGMALTGLVCGYGSLILVSSLAGYAVYKHKEANRIEAAQIAEEIRRGKQLYQLVLKYEADHGKFPDALSELVSGGYVTTLDNLQPEAGGNWIYFRGLTSQSSSYKYFIRSQTHKVCIFVDGTDGSRDLHYTLEPTDFPVRGHEAVME